MTVSPPSLPFFSLSHTLPLSLPAFVVFAVLACAALPGQIVSTATTRRATRCCANVSPMRSRISSVSRASPLPNTACTPLLPSPRPRCSRVPHSCRCPLLLLRWLFPLLCRLFFFLSLSSIDLLLAPPRLSLSLFLSASVSPSPLFPFSPFLFASPRVLFTVLRPLVRPFVAPRFTPLYPLCASLSSSFSRAALPSACASDSCVGMYVYVCV